MRRTRGVLFAAAFLPLALAGCSTSVSGAAAPAVTLSPVVPLKVEGQPAWGAEQVGVPGLQAVQFGTDTAVVMGSATWPSTDAAIAGVDPATGTVRWSYADYAELAGGDGAGYVGGTAAWGNLARIVSVGGDPADQIVVVTYLTTTCTDASGFCPSSGSDVTDEYGIAALNPTDGSVRWKAPIVPAVPGDSPRRTRPGASARCWSMPMPTASWSWSATARTSTAPARPALRRCARCCWTRPPARCGGRPLAPAVRG